MRVFGVHGTTSGALGHEACGGPGVREGMTIVRRAALVLGVLLGLFLLAFAATSGPWEVPKTVVDDPSLPSVTIAGVRLHVRTFGDPTRPVVIVLHGGPGHDLRYLLPLSELADEFFVVFYDQRGSGLSERVRDEQLTLEGMYEELDGVIDHFAHGEPVRLVGHSWGAMLASGYLGRHPEKVSHAVLAEPGMLTSEAGRRFMRATNGMRPPLTPEVARLGLVAWLRSLHVPETDTDARADFLNAQLINARFAGHPMENYFCNKDLSTARLEAARPGARVAPALLGTAVDANGDVSVDFVRGVERFRGSVLFLVGACSQVVGEAHQRLHLAHFPGASLRVLPGVGHTMFGEAPGESVAAVRRFFAGASAEVVR